MSAYVRVTGPWGLSYTVPAERVEAERIRIAGEYAAIQARAAAPSPHSGSIYGRR